MKIILEGYIWKSQQNGGVFNPEGICPTIACGAHAGCQPKIIEYEDNTTSEPHAGWNVQDYQGAVLQE